MWKIRILTCVIILCSGLGTEVQAQNYHASKLVRNLLKIGYPLDREDVSALDKIGMRFDSKNRITVLEKILQDRDFIHSRKDIDYFIRTEIISDALRLLDEHNLPVTHRLIDEFNQQAGWEKREKVLLAYMAAKRDIRYPSNAVYLLSVLHQYGKDLERIDSAESTQTILDDMNCLSYLADLFVYKGDKDILNGLILYSSGASGFPGEYLSHRFIDMLLLRPKVFISTLAGKDDQTIDTVMNALIFGIRNNEVRAKVKEVLQKDLFTADEPNQHSSALLVNRLNAQIDLTVNKPVTKKPGAHANSSK
jgi:hypothetical protein